MASSIFVQDLHPGSTIILGLLGGKFSLTVHCGAVLKPLEGSNIDLVINEGGSSAMTTRVPLII